MRDFGLFFGGLWLPILSQSGALSIIDTFGSFFGPIAGIIIADYYLIKNKEGQFKINEKWIKSPMYIFTEV